MIWLCGTSEKMCLLGGHPMVITMDWYQGSFHPVLPSITHPQQTWDSVELGQWLTPQMAWIQSKPTMIQGEIQYSSPGKNNQYRIPEQVRSGLAGHSPAGNGLPGNAWLNPSQQCTLIQSRQNTEHYSQASTWRAYFALLCSNLDTAQFWHHQFKRDVEKLELVH